MASHFGTLRQITFFKKKCPFFFKHSLKLEVWAMALFVDDENQMSYIKISDGGSEASIYCHGAHLTSWKVGGVEQIFVSGIISIFIFCPTPNSLFHIPPHLQNKPSSSPPKRSAVASQFAGLNSVTLGHLVNMDLLEIQLGFLKLNLRILFCSV